MDDVFKQLTSDGGERDWPKVCCLLFTSITYLNLKIWTMDALRHSVGIVSVSKDVWNIMVMMVEYSMLKYLSSRAGTMSGPVALCGFRPWSHLCTPLFGPHISDMVG